MDLCSLRLPVSSVLSSLFVALHYLLSDDKNLNKWWFYRIRQDAPKCIATTVCFWRTRVCPANSVSFGPVGLRRSIYNNYPNFVKISRTVAKYSDLTFFKMEAVRHLGFSKNSKCYWPMELRRSRCSTCQISWRSSEPLPKCDDFLDFKIVAAIFDF